MSVISPYPVAHDDAAIVTDRRAPVIALSVAGLAVAAQSWISIPTLCPVRICTGHACPGCGMTRAIAAGVRGDFGLSWRYHPLAALVVVWVAAWATRAMIGRPLVQWTAETRTRLWQGHAALFIVVWAARWATGTLDFVLLTG